MNDNLDPMQVGKSLDMFPDQIKSTYTQALDSNIEPLEFDNVLVSGMGGSSNAGKIIQSLIERESKIPFTVFNDYGLPSWVNDRTLVVANSYSGNTEETISAYEAAKEVGCKVIAVSTGGKLSDLINSGELKGAVVSYEETNPSKFPKAGLGISFGALFGALTKVGLIKTSQDVLFSALDELVEVRTNWDVEVSAKWLEGFAPIFFGSRTFLGSLNSGRNACCEIGRVFTQFYDFPEVNHVLVEALQKPDWIKEKFKYLFFESSFDHERVTRRYEVTKGILDEMNLSYRTYKLSTSTFLAQSLELPHYCAWIGYHLSMMRQEDPGPEPWIIKLKQSLSQPTH